MSAGRVIAGCAAALLLLPGLCFFVVGVSLANARGSIPSGIELILVGLGIFVGAGFLFRTAFRAPEALEDSPNVVKVRHPTETESSQEPAPPKDPPTSDA